MQRFASQTPDLAVGLGLKPQHAVAAIAQPTSDGLWFEVHAENHMVAGGPRLSWLRAVADRFPVSIHGVGLSIAGPAPLDMVHIKRLKALIDAIQPALVSEHMAWCYDGQVYYPDLFAPTRTTVLLEHVCQRINTIQSVLGRSIALENATHYRSDIQHQLTEADFWSEVLTRTQCKLLFDVNNALLSAHNLQQPAEEALDWLKSIAPSSVAQLHLAGYVSDPLLGDVLRIDNHGSPIAPETWAAYEQVLAYLGPVPTLIEWDNHVPEFDVLMQSRAQAMVHWRRASQELSCV